MHFRPISLVCTAKASATHRADRLAHENGRRAWQNRCTDDGSAQVQTTSSPANRRYFGAREMTWRSIAHFSCNGRRRRLPSLVRSAPRVPPSSAGAPRSTNTQAAARPRPGMHSGTQSRNKEPTMISAPPAASGAALKQASGTDVLRILCLHGYVQNSNVFRKKIGGLRKAVKNIAEFDFVDAPHSAAGAFGQTAKDADGGSAEDGPPLGWWNAGENQDAGPGKEWVRPSISKRALGAHESLETIKRAVKANGPFDGILGFSQGATMGAMLLATEPTAAHFAVLAGGFIPFDETMAQIMTSGAPIPAEALIVSGETDQLVPPERSRHLQALFGGHTEFYSHPGGHGIPSSADWRNFLKNFLLKQQERKKNGYVATTAGVAAAAAAARP